VSVRLLPPLAALLVCALIVGRCMAEPFRDESQAQIQGLLEGADFKAALSKLESYLERYHEDEDQWFATQAWFAMRRPDRAIDQIWSHPTISQQPGTARRFARTGLLALGWTDLGHLRPTGLEPFVLTALVDGEDAWAEEKLRHHASTLPMQMTTLYFFPAYRRANERPLEVIVDAYRERGEDDFDVAAALAGLKPEDYPEKAGDIARLQRVIADPRWRQQYLDVWGVAAVALGRSGDPAALRSLKEVEAGLEGATSQRDQEALALVRNGLIAGGDWSGVEDCLARAQSDVASPIATLWLLEALIHRYRVGDMRAEAGLVAFWTTLGERFPSMRARMARAFLLQDEPPSEEAVQHWVDRMLDDLRRPNGPPMSRILAEAWRLRSGAPGSREAMIEALRDAGRLLQSDPSQASELQEPFLEGLRALFLYG
jgi:hypothetical protein